MKSYRKNLFAGTIWFCVTAFYCYQYILRVIPNLIMPSLFEQYSIGAKEFGSFAGIYYIGYIIVHIPIGLLLDRIGAKIILPLSIILAGIGLLPIMYSTNWNYVLLGRLLTGVGSSAAIVGAIQIFRIIFAQNFSRMLGFMVFFGLITAVYSNIPLSILLNDIGIESMIKIVVAIGLFLAILTYHIMPKELTKTKHVDILTEIKTVFSSYKLLIVSVLAGLMVGPLEGFADAWCTSFIQTVYGIDNITATSIGSSILTGMCIGSIILPYIADKYNAHYSVTITAAIAMALGFVYLLGGSGTILGLYAACLLIGFFCSYQIVIISKISTYLPENLSGTSGSVVNMIIMAFGFVFHNVIGSIMNGLWDGTVLNGVKAYHHDTYIVGMSVIPFAILIALVGLTIVATSKSKKIKQ